MTTYCFMGMLGQELADPAVLKLINVIDDMWPVATIIRLNFSGIKFI